MEIALTAAMWIFALLLLFLLPILVYWLLHIRAGLGKIAVLISCALLAAELLFITLTTLHPPIINTTGRPLSASDEERVRYVSDGSFNARLPVFPMAVILTENSPELLRWKTVYGFLGTTEHIWDPVNECYECTDRLWD